MTNREIFINYVEPMMDQAPEEAVKYFETIKNKKEKEAPEITELGYRILAAMQTDPECEFTAKMLGEAVSAIAGFEVTGRTASGGTRKLITKGYITKVEGSTPPAYVLTELGAAVDTTQMSTEE